MTAPTRLDASDRSIVAWCVECPSWRAVDTSRPRLLRTVSAHLESVHGTGAKQREQAARIDRRHAEG